MKHLLTVLLFLSVAIAASAQNFNIKGEVVDDTGNILPAATVMLLKAQDSTLVNFTVTDDKGQFEIKNVSKETWLIKTTFIGYIPSNVKFDPPAGNILDIGKITMQPKATELNAVTVQGEHIPVIVKKDTIEYNARAFKTQNNAVVEDLLKQLPGVEVDNNGDITAQGEQVQRVTVDGKEFFGRDPKLATRNLPADAVEKVQVVDGKSEQARFSGIDDGQREKLINLELKEDKKNGVFGNAMAGAGTDERFEAKTSLNRFSKGNQFSLLGMANNTNQQGFSMDEYMNFTGTASQMMSGGGGRVMLNVNNSSGIPLSIGNNNSNGVMTTIAGGLNFNKDLRKDLELNGSYFINHLDHNISQSLLRENFQPDPENNFDYLENAVQENFNNNHRGNMTIDYSIDSANSLRFNGNISFNNMTGNSIGTSQTIREDGILQNESSQLSSTTGGSVNSTGNFLYRHRFAKKGRTVSVDTDLSYQSNESDGTLEAVNSFYGEFPTETILRQESSQFTENTVLGSTVSYTEPLGGRKYLEANYTIRQNRNNVDRQVYDVENEQRELNSLLSNKYISNYLYQRSGINFRYNQRKYKLTMGVAYQATQLEGQLKLQDIEINQNFNNILPVARLNYEFTTYKRMNVDYETSVQEPTIQQLQPVVDNRNPLNIYEGNPILEPAYRHNLRISFNTFDPLKFLGFFSFIDVNYTDNAIINSQYVDEQFIRYTTPVNIGNTLDIRVNGNLSLPLTAIKSRINIGTSLNDRYSATILNDVESDIRQSSVSLNLRYNFKYKEMLDLDLTGSLNKQVSDYELNQPDQAFINSTYIAEANYNFLENYQFRIEYNYLIYNNENLDFKEDISMLNLSLARSFLKNNKGELKLSALNVLDENVGVTQNAGLNYVERQVTNSLGRYFMFSFTYMLNKQLNPMGGRGRGGVIIRQ